MSVESLADWLRQNRKNRVFQSIDSTELNKNSVSFGGNALTRQNYETGCFNVLTRQNWKRAFQDDSTELKKTPGVSMYWLDRTEKRVFRCDSKELKKAFPSQYWHDRTEKRALN